MWRRRKKDRHLRQSSNFLSKPYSNIQSPPKSSKEIESSSPKGQLCRQFTIDQIRSATQYFNNSLLIGQGGFGSVYKGIIKNGKSTTVALKRRSSTSSQGVREFQVEVDLLPTLRHPNIVSLIGYCTDGNKEMVLVYEYMSNGSLGSHLHQLLTPLSFSQRLKICIDVAHALNYLHNGTSGQEVIYNNVKSADILLDNQWTPKITDFGVSRTIPFDSYSTHVSTGVVGTVGYIDPEYMATGRLSKKSDVYAFGVVLLEVLCRRRPLDIRLDDEHRVLMKRFKDCIRTGKLEQIIDPELRGQISLNCLNDYENIAKGCLHEKQEPRITMADVVLGLESILALHERNDKSIPQIGITTSDWRLQKHFFSEPNPGGSYFRKDMDLLSVIPHLNEGDHGDMLDKEFDVITEKSWGIEMTPVRSIRYPGEDSDSASEPDREVIDGVDEVISRDQTMKYIQHADGLMRMIDFLHLIWFYPMKKEAEVNFGRLLDKFSFVNEYIRKSLDSSKDEGYLMEIQTLLQDIEEDLDDSAFDMVAYLPEDNRSMSLEFDNLATGASYWSGIPEVHASAIASATQRAISCIKDLKVKKLGTAGSGAMEVAETLRNMPELRSVFDMVLCVRVKHDSIKELMNDIEVEMHLWRKRSSKKGDKVVIQDQLMNCLLFVDCSDAYIDLHDPEFNLSKWFGTVQIVITSESQNAYCPVDIEIRVEDHLLPWILFFINVDLATMVKYPNITQMAKRLIENCHGHLLAIILLARALRGVFNESSWELALQELTSQKELSSSPLVVTSDVMVRVLRFIWSRMETLSQRCIIQFASRYVGSEFKESTLINCWIKDGLVEGEQEGEDVFEDLISSFLIEQVGEDCVRMRKEIRVILVTYFVRHGYEVYPKQDGSEPNKMPNIEESDSWEIQISNHIISDLPDNPNCPNLVNLFLQLNQDLIDIPITFFDNMPNLQVLNLSSTSIKCLPSSISKLTRLQKLFIRDCDLLMELPPEIGALKNLKVFDSEGTHLICLPKQFGSLTKLKCLKVSLYNFTNKNKRSNESMQIISTSVLSKLTRLKELIICVDSYDKWWEDEVKHIFDILPKFGNLESLRLYFPTTELLEMFMEIQNWIGIPIYQYLSNFGFVVGHLQERMISRVPHDLDKTFVKLPKCLKYTNGEGDTEVISRMLNYADAFFLDRHWTARSLSTIGLAEMKKLKFCLLSECNEMLEIVHIRYLSSLRPVLGSLEHLSIHYMKSLTCILNGPSYATCLLNLKTLAIHMCPELRTIFTQGLLDSLTCLEYLIVEDCTKIKSLVSLDTDHSTSTACLPSLKKISLLHLPQLFSISRGVSIAPRLESLVVYDCPNLEKLSYMEAFDHITEIKGVNEWWDALKWCEPDWTSGRPDYLVNVFIPLGTNGDIMDELADAMNLLPHFTN